MTDILQHEEEELAKDYDLLRQLEDTLRYETQPQPRKQAETQIKNLKKVMEDRESKLRGRNPLNHTLFEGYKLLNNKDFDRAEAKFDEANRFEPKSPEPWYWKSKTALAKGNMMVAFAYINKALEIDSDHLHCVGFKIKLLLLSGGHDKLKIKEIAARIRGRSETFDSWLDCITIKIVDNLVIINYDLEQKCPSPDYKW